MDAGVAYRTPGAAYIIKKRYIPKARIYRGRLVVLVCTTERQFRVFSKRMFCSVLFCSVSGAFWSFLELSTPFSLDEVKAIAHNVSAMG
jgi:hypothetical protein